MTTDRPKTVWAAGINLMGLWGPYKMNYDQTLKEYYDSTGDFSVKGTGTKNKNGKLITFASTNKQETNLWVNGAKAAMCLVKQWCT